MVGVKGGNGGSRVRRGKNGETSVESINFGPLATWIGFNLRMAQESAFQAFSRLSQEIGESPGRFATLTLIARNPGISQTELSLANGRDKSSLTPVVEDLVKRGLVERKRIRCITSIPADDVRTWLGVQSAEIEAGHLKIVASDADSVVRRLLSADAHCRDLEVQRAGLAEAFTELTQEAA